MSTRVTSSNSRAAIRYQYPVSDNFTADLRLPRNMSNAEAERLCAFIKTLVIGPTVTTSSTPYQATYLVREP